MKLIINDKIINLKYMNTFFKRFKGLMFKKNINEYLIFKTNSIHTFFCLKPLDIIMLDKNYKVLYIYKGLKQFKVILPKKNVKYTIEMEENKINKLNIKLKDKLKIEE